jgi:hypothetical protein
MDSYHFGFLGFLAATEVGLRGVAAAREEDDGEYVEERTRKEGSAGTRWRKVRN